MEKAKFSVTLSPALPGSVPGDPTLAATPSGLDQVEFIAQTNPGQLAQPLRKIASGGEMSRIMLALKGILAASDRISVLVFDEIDANVGGRLGSIIGGKLRQLAEHHQVLCITHLPQIASLASRHYSIAKDPTADPARTTVTPLDGKAVVAELVRMLGADADDVAARRHAKELLKAA
jgi:DNA repair protein RecN (Recombination protein N)